MEKIRRGLQGMSDTVLRGRSVMSTKMNNVGAMEITTVRDFLTQVRPSSPIHPPLIHPSTHPPPTYPPQNSPCTCSTSSRAKRWWPRDLEEGVQEGGWGWVGRQRRPRRGHGRVGGCKAHLGNCGGIAGTRRRMRRRIERRGGWVGGLGVDRGLGKEGRWRGEGKERKP